MTYGWEEISSVASSPSLRKEADAAYHWLQSEGFIDNEQNVTQKIFPPAIIELISKLDPKIVPPQNLIKLFRFYLSQAILSKC